MLEHLLDSKLLQRLRRVRLSKTLLGEQGGWILCNRAAELVEAERLERIELSSFMMLADLTRELTTVLEGKLGLIERW